jgi:hypothetical protein
MSYILHQSITDIEQIRGPLRGQKLNCEVAHFL